MRIQFSALLTLLFFLVPQIGDAANPDSPELLAGAYAIDVSPDQYPVIVNGMFTERSATKAHDPLHARCLVLASGKTQIAIVVVDSCGMMREYLDEAKELAEKATGIPTANILVSATHTHSAPSAWPALGSRVEPTYIPFLVRQIARGIELAQKNLAPAEIGWGVMENYEEDFCRRWITRSDSLQTDPFGDANVHAMMHPGFQNPNYISPSGPIDPDLTILSVRNKSGQPIALLANYSMHYFGSPLLSADYFGHFASEIKSRLKLENSEPAFVGIMSQGTSGDSMWKDYSRKSHTRQLSEFSQTMADKAIKVYEQIKYQDRLELGMLETKITLGRRLPDPERLAKSEELLTKIGDRLPKTRPEVYAFEQRYLHAEPRRELKLQVIRIGAFGIAAWPNEVYNLTGLKLKAQSPLPIMINIELANGSEGYIPPAEQHLLGGYTTWPARSAGLEVQAEAKISERLLAMQEQLTGRSRKQPSVASGKYEETVLASKPIAYWRLNDMTGPTAINTIKGPATSVGQAGEYQYKVAYYLPGVESSGFETKDRGNRAVHFAGGRLKTSLPELGEAFSIELWLWNGFPTELREVTGHLFCFESAEAANTENGSEAGLLQVALAGKGEHAGQLRLITGGPKSQTVFGNTAIPLKQWQHLVLVQDKEGLRAYLNGKLEPEIDVKGVRANVDKTLYFAGNAQDPVAAEANKNSANFEGKLDELAVFNRALTPAEIQQHYQAGKGE